MGSRNIGRALIAFFFGGILFSFLSRVVDVIEDPCSRGELLACAHRLYLAVALIEQATLTHYLSLVKERLSERDQRLRGFNRALSHELRNLIGTISGTFRTGTMRARL